jgi:hypothetical protein
VVLDMPSKFRAALMKCGFTTELIDKLPPILEGETETRLRALVARAPIEIDRDAGFIERSHQECKDAVEGFCAAWKAAKLWDDLVRPQTAYDKAVEAQRAKSRLRLVKDDE